LVICKNELISSCNSTFIFKGKQREKTTSMSKREISWITAYMSACHGVSLWRDVVF